MTANIISYFRALEEKRANQASERLRSQELEEQQRHNIAAETISKQQVAVEQQKADEISRHNRATESEVQRHDITTETISAQQVGLGYAQVGLGYAQLKETSRHNVNTEFVEKKRVIVQSYQASVNKAIQDAVTAETARHNRATEAIQAKHTNAEVWTLLTKTAVAIPKIVGLY